MAKNRSRLFNPARADRTANSDEMAAAKKDRTQMFNQLALLFLVMTVIMLACYALILAVPGLVPAQLRPVAPVTITLPATITPSITPTSTRTPHPTNTPTNTLPPSPTATETVPPSETPRPSPTLLGGRKGTPQSSPTPTLTSTPTIAGTATPTKSPLNYTADLTYQRAQLYGTSWAGIAGLVLDPNLKHQQNIDVRAWGDPPLGADGQTLPSGTFVQYGLSGWQFTLGDQPMSGKWHVQLIDEKGNPLSPIVDIEMDGDPSANLAYIIFQQNH